jgi:hypothetical protein
MTEKEMILTLFKAVGALAERLTGERLEIPIQTEDGSLVVTSEPGIWKPITQATAAEGRSAEQVEHPAKSAA